MKYWKEYKVKRFVKRLFPFITKRVHKEKVRQLQGQIGDVENRIKSSIADGVKSEKAALDAALRQITTLEMSPPLEGDRYRLTMSLSRNIFRGMSNLSEIGYIADHFSRTVRFKVMELFTGTPDNTP